MEIFVDDKDHTEGKDYIKAVCSGCGKQYKEADIDSETKFCCYDCALKALRALYDEEDRKIKEEEDREENVRLQADEYFKNEIRVEEGENLPEGVDKHIRETIIDQICYLCEKESDEDYIVDTFFDSCEFDKTDNPDWLKYSIFMCTDELRNVALFLKTKTHEERVSIIKHCINECVRRHLLARGHEQSIRYKNSLVNIENLPNTSRTVIEEAIRINHGGKPDGYEEKKKRDKIKTMLEANPSYYRRYDGSEKTVYYDLNGYRRMSTLAEFEADENLASEVRQNKFSRMKIN